VCQLRPAPGGAEERRGWQGHRAGKVAPPERMLRRVRGTQKHRQLPIGMFVEPMAMQQEAKKMKVPTIYKAYFLGLCKGISPQNMA